MKKRIFLAAFILMMGILFAACGNTSNQSASPEDGNTITESIETEAAKIEDALMGTDKPSETAKP